MGLTQEQIHEIVRCRSSYRYTARNYLQIANPARKIIPFNFNYGQEIMWKKAFAGYPDCKVRIIILKYRQGIGCSTFCCGLGFSEMQHRRGFEGRHIVDHQAHGLGFCKKYHIFHLQLPHWMKHPSTKIGSLSASIQDRNSHVQFNSAGQGAKPPRSETLQFVHFSEIAFYPAPKEFVDATIPTVHDVDGTFVIYESTPNMLGDYFYTLCDDTQAGRTDYQFFFFPWFGDPQYVEFKDFPFEPETEEEVKAMKAHHLSDAQMFWRRKMIYDFAKGADYADGLRKFKREYPEDPVSCFMASSFSFFDPDVVYRHLQAVDAEGIEPMEETGLPDYFKIFYPPVKGRKYAIGADVSEGGDTGDYNAAVVFDCKTGLQVATLYGQFSLERYAEYLNLLGRYYNEALIAVERNGLGTSVILLLKNIYNYYRQYYDYGRGKSGGVLRDLGRLGFYTSTATKNHILGQFRIALNGDAVLLCDKTILRELLYFQEKGGKREAAPSKHDDLVMASVIGWEAIEQASGGGVSIL